MRFFRSTILLFTLITTVGLLQLHAQNIQTQFGKNRVQFHDGQWSSYESENFVVYFYQGGKEVARYVLQYAEQNVSGVEQILEHTLSRKVEILVYQNYSDVIQTNIGIGIDQNNQGGVTQILGNKIFLYYNGDHKQLEQQIIEGLAKVHIDHMIFGTNIQEIIQNAILLNLPGWFVNGLVAYVAEPWNTDLDSQLKVAVQNGRLKNFNRLEDNEQTFAGRALWQYIAENYGEVAISNILYITRINRSVDTGFRFVTGRSLEEIVADWRLASLAEIDNELAVRDSVDFGEHFFSTKKRRAKAFLTSMKVSPSGKYVAYSSNELGKLRVFVYDMETNELDRVSKSGFKTYSLPLDAGEPLLAWSNKAEMLAFVYTRKDVIWLNILNMETGELEKAPITKFQQVNGLTWSANNRNLYLSAVRSGKSDLYKYSIRNTKTTKLTNDVYDDLGLTYVDLGSRKGLIFSSNRPDGSLAELKLDSFMVKQLPFNDFDLFFYPLGEGEPEALYQLTDTDFANEKQACRFDGKKYAYLGDDNGIYNEYVGFVDSSFSHIDTTIYYADSIVTNPGYLVDLTDELIEEVKLDSVFVYYGSNRAVSNEFKNINYLSVAYKRGLNVTANNNFKQNYFFKQSVKNLSDRDVGDLKNTEYFSFLKKVGLDIVDSDQEDDVEDFTDEVDEEEVVEELVDSADYIYQSPFDYWTYPELEGTIETTTLAGTDLSNSEYGSINARIERDKKLLEYRKSKARVYKPKFAMDYIVTQVDDSPVFASGMESSIGGTAAFNPSLKGMIKLGISDLFENYKLIGGFRIPVSNLDSREIFVEFQNLKHRIDRKTMIYRKAEGLSTNNGSSLVPGIDDVSFDKSKTLFVRHSLIYPFNFISSMRFHVGVRNDQLTPLITNEDAIAREPSVENAFISRVEYVFDNTLRVGENLLQGTRLKVYAEYQKPFTAVISDSDFDIGFKNGRNSFILGTDIRHYQKIHRQITFASRFSAGISMGSVRTLYMLGAVEGWIQFDPEKYIDSSTPIAQQDFAYQALAPNLRGFPFNVRNGSKYAVMNLELRVPLFTYLIQRPIKSQFLRDFQITAFFDSGTAWDNGSPFSEENRFYTYYYPDDPNTNTPQHFEVRYFKNPIVYGYGTGVRSTILGYYVKLDVGWGVDSGNRTPKPTWYFSLGYDF